MNKFFLVSLLTILSCSLFTTGATAEDSISDLWSKVMSAQSDGLPKSAITHLDEIIKLAMHSNDATQVLKALTLRISLEANIQGNKPQEKITRMKAEIALATPKLKPIFQSILARWYWQYYQQNSWRFQNRSTTASLDDEDFTTWDLKKIFTEIDKLHQLALASPEILQNTPIEELDSFLVAGNVTMGTRPTLYDFLAHEAINFYTSSDQPIARPQDAFELDGNGPVLDNAAVFMDWKPTTTDTESPLLKSVLLYQTLLAFHKSKENQGAFADVDLLRLRFAYQKAFGPDKKSRYLTRLKEFCSDYSSLELSTLADYYRAEIFRQDNRLLEAYSLAEMAAARFPNSMGGNNCTTLMNQITAPEFTINGEKIIPPMQKNNFTLSYKNITHLHIRIIKDRWDHFVDEKWQSPDYCNNELMNELLAKTPLHKWKLTLPATTDYQSRPYTEILPALPHGYYRLIISHREDFSQHQRNRVESFSFQVTELGLAWRSGEYAEQSGIVTNAETGQPIENVKVKTYRQTDSGNWREESQVVTNSDGLFAAPIPTNQHRSRFLYISKGNDSYFESSSLNSGYERGIPNTENKTIFFTNRSLYRPGQTIHFKGVVIKYNHQADDYQVVNNRSVKVGLYNTNGQHVSSLDFVTNEFGSFNGSFTAPTEGLKGSMSLQASSPHGYTSFRVEEYKRPKFRVELTKPTDASRVNDSVKVTGTALSYAGAPMDGAMVKYRVVREVQLPWWCFWWRWAPGTSQSREISNGRTKTDEQGNFEMVFRAEPDKSVPAENSPVFNYKVIADVTDSTGETRSGTTVTRVGYTAMEATIQTEEWLTPSNVTPLTITTKTLDGKDVPAQGKVTIFALSGPEKPVRKILESYNRWWWWHPPEKEKKTDHYEKGSDWKLWPNGEQVTEFTFNTTDNPNFQHEQVFPAGVYRAVLSSVDRFGKTVKAELPFMVLDPTSESFPLPLAHLFKTKSNSVEVGDSMELLWGSGYDNPTAFVEIEHRNKIIKRFWINNRSQHHFKFAVTEEMRGGFTLRLLQVRDYRFYSHSEKINVPWSNKQLQLSFETFRSILRPGEKETWKIHLKGPAAEKIAAELAATLYDESLDAFNPHDWSDFTGYFRQDYSHISTSFANQQLSGTSWVSRWYTSGSINSPVYRRYPSVLTENLFGYGYHYKGDMLMECDGAIPPMPNKSMRMSSKKMAPSGRSANFAMSDEVAPSAQALGGAPEAELAAPAEAKPEPDLSKVAARTNLSENAFFFPQVLADQSGNYTLEFTMPEALTKWKFIGFAHGKKLESALLTGHTVTRKELMVQPNPPRFLREGDILEFPVKVSNLSDKTMDGKIKLSFRDAVTEKNVDKSLSLINLTKAFKLEAKRSTTIFWKIKVADGLEPVLFKVVAAAEDFSDGEEGMLPVLSRRIRVIETMPLPIRGPEKKEFTFKKLVDSGSSNSLEHLSFTVQVCSNPAWYAVQALPYLMEFQHECSEQLFNRLYANALARYIAESDPKIRRVFDQWRGTDALKSNLQKNQQLKTALLEETPWVLDAKNEEQAKQNVGILFEQNRLNHELTRAFDKLSNQQLSSGAWPWFPGGRENSYITLYITTGFGRLRKLGVKQDVTPAIKALAHLDAWIQERYDWIVKHGHLDKVNIGSTEALYLYGRSLFLKDRPIPTKHKTAVVYFLKQAKEHWLKIGNRMSQGHLALALGAFGDKATPEKIVNSLRERSVNHEEMGMYWAENENSWWWYRAPIETQALMVEVFDEVAHDEKAVEDCKVWLIKQKQTQNWQTTKATADAIYALLLKGSDLLASDELVAVSLGGKTVKPKKVEAGTGFYEKTFPGEIVKPEMGNIVLEKKDKGVAWGSVYWQYLEDMSKVTPHHTNLSLKKKLFVKKNTKAGPVITEVKEALNPGDLLVVRIELRSDRDMEFVHLKDHRGTGLEPVDVLSKYRYQDGLAYYQSTLDTASHFFIDYLPKGTYIFEYELRVQLKGLYQTGMASIQCMYAPEFSSHSESIPLTVE